jgi:hypothetical protein
MYYVVHKFPNLSKVVIRLGTHAHPTLLHIVPFCEGPNEKPKGFAKQKQKTIRVCEAKTKNHKGLRSKNKKP